MKTERIKIESSDDLLCIIDDMYHEFLSSLKEKDWATREVEEGELVGDYGWEFIWTTEGQDYVFRYKRRMREVFNKHFSDKMFRVYSPLYQEE